MLSSQVVETMILIIGVFLWPPIIPNKIREVSPFHIIDFSQSQTRFSINATLDRGLGPKVLGQQDEMKHDEFLRVTVTAGLFALLFLGWELTPFS